MKKEPKVGVFLCECGSKIKPFIDIVNLEKKLNEENDISLCKIIPFSCLQPGLESIVYETSKKEINRLIICGCESRLMLPKFKKMLSTSELEVFEEQIEMINIRGHVISNNKFPKKLKTNKVFKLIKAAVFEMHTLKPTPDKKIYMNKPVMLLGEDLGCWIVAKSFEDKGIDCLMQEQAFKMGNVEKKLKAKFLGSIDYLNKFESIRSKIINGNSIKIIPQSKLVSMSGVTSNYELVFVNDKGNHDIYNVSAVIYCSDCEFTTSSGYPDNSTKRIIPQNKLHSNISQKGIPNNGNIVFWIDDCERGYPEFAELSFKSAWLLIKEIKDNSCNITILYNDSIPLQTNPINLEIAKKMKVNLIPYSDGYMPIIKDKTINSFDNTSGNENEIFWDFIVTSPKRFVNKKHIKIAEILGIKQGKNNFLEINHSRVKPQQQGKGGVTLIGTSHRPSSLQKIISDSYKAANNVTMMIERSRNEGISIPRRICTIDSNKCSGCGLASSVCENSCFAVPGSGTISKADPMLCTGGGTCTAACPYGALDLQNSTTEQREARVTSLSNQLEPEEFIVAGCTWGGLVCADNATKNTLAFTNSAYVIGVPCVGQLDIRVLARAFLEGASGLLLMGCTPGTCHHSYGVDHAWSRIDLIKKLLDMCGFNSKRIGLGFSDLNKPENFVRTVNEFGKVIKGIGPIEKNKKNVNKLKSLYDLTSNNIRIRHLLCTNLRTIEESEFLGSRNDSIVKDREFYSEVEDEFFKTRIKNLIANSDNLLNKKAIEKLMEESSNVKLGEYLSAMVHSKTLNVSYKNREAFYKI